MTTPTTSSPSALQQLLAAPADGTISFSPTVQGFGGLHGGLALARAVAEMDVLAEGRPLLSASASFLAAVNADAQVTAQQIRAGRSVLHAAATISQDGAPRLLARGIYGSLRGDQDASLAAQRSRSTRLTGPAMPQVAPADELAPLGDLGGDQPSFISHVDIRPATAALPYGGGEEPVLTAWIGLRGADAPPDAAALITLTDALAPSYSAILRDFAPVPSVELNVHLHAGAVASTPCVLARAATTAIDGPRVTEEIDLWDADGSWLARATQLRLVLGRDG